MSNETFYVVKGTILGKAGIALANGTIVRSDSQVERAGIRKEEIPRLIKQGFLAPATVETLADVKNAKAIKTPQLIDGTSEEDMSTHIKKKVEDKALDEIDANAPFRNDPNNVLGYDEKYLAQKDDRELRETIKQAVPGFSDSQLDSMPRTQLVDILQSQRDTGPAEQVTHETPGGEITPKT